jgi:hypothetical protein
LPPVDGSDLSRWWENDREEAVERERVESKRKTLTAACMIAAPILFLASDSIWPVTSSEPEDMLADAINNTGRVYAATLLALTAMVLMVGAVIGLAHLLRERRPGLAVVGGALGLTGIVSIAAAFGAFGIVLAEVGAGDEVAARAEFLEDVMGRALPAFILGMLLNVGLIVLATGLYKARVVASWSAVALGVGAVVLAVANPLGAKPVILAAEVVLLAGLGSIGWLILTETEEEWEHTPQLRGYGSPVPAG